MGDVLARLRGGKAVKGQTVCSRFNHENCWKITTQEKVKFRKMMRYESPWNASKENPAALFNQIRHKRRVWDRGQTRSRKTSPGRTKEGEPEKACK